MSEPCEDEVSLEFKSSACISVFMYIASIVYTLSAGNPDSHCLLNFPLFPRRKISPPPSQSAACYLVFLGWAFGKPRLNILFLLCNFYSSFRAALLEELFAHCLQLCPVWGKKQKKNTKKKGKETPCFRDFGGILEHPALNAVCSLAGKWQEYKSN